MAYKTQVWTILFLSGWASVTRFCCSRVGRYNKPSRQKERDDHAMHPVWECSDPQGWADAPRRAALAV